MVGGSKMSLTPFFLSTIQFYRTIIFHQFVWMRVKEEPHWQGTSIVKTQSFMHLVAEGLLYGKAFTGTGPIKSWSPGELHNSK